jgi:hypothetical protein
MPTETKPTLECGNNNALLVFEFSPDTLRLRIGTGNAYLDRDAASKLAAHLNHFVETGSPRL